MYYSLDRVKQHQGHFDKMRKIWPMKAIHTITWGKKRSKVKSPFHGNETMDHFMNVVSFRRRQTTKKTAAVL